MKLKDYGGDIRKVLLKIPKKYQNKDMGIFPQMYIVGIWSRGVWLKLAEHSDHRIPLMIYPETLLDFDIITEKIEKN